MPRANGADARRAAVPSVTPIAFRLDVMVGGGANVRGVCSEIESAPIRAFTAFDSSVDVIE